MHLQTASTGDIYLQQAVEQAALLALPTEHPVLAEPL